MEGQVLETAVLCLYGKVCYGASVRSQQTEREMVPTSRSCPGTRIAEFDWTVGTKLSISGENCTIGDDAYIPPYDLRESGYCRGEHIIMSGS